MPQHQPGLLNKLLNTPGQGDALGMLGAYLLQAGATTTDPGASQRGIGQAMSEYVKALQGGRSSRAEGAYRKAQMADLESRTEEREAGQLATQRARNALTMGPGGPRVGAQGLLSQVPESQRELIRGMAAADPMAAYKAALGATKPQERYETVQNPYGLGGVGQRESGTGKISGYQKPVKPTERQREIDDLMSRGVPRERAQDLVAGRIRTITDPRTGVSSLVNVVTGKAKPIRGQPSPETALSKKTRNDIQESNIQIDRMLGQFGELEGSLDAGVGALSVAKEYGAKVLGQLPDAKLDTPLGEIGTGKHAAQPETIRARQKIRILREDLIKALAKNPRVPLAEQQRIANMLPSDGFFESAAAARDALAEVKAYLQRMHKENATLLKGGAVEREKRIDDLRRKYGLE